MKKVFTLLTIAAAFTFTACNEAAEETHADEAATTEEVVTEEEVETEEAPAMEADTMTIVDEAVEAGEEMMEEGAEAVDAIEEMAH